MTRITIHDLNQSRNNNVTYDLADSDLQGVLGGASYSYTLDLGTVRNQLSGLANEIQQLDGRTVTLSITSSQGGSTGGTVTQPTVPKPAPQPATGFYVMPVPNY